MDSDSKDTKIDDDVLTNEKDYADSLSKTEYGDVLKNDNLVKRTLMVSAFPAMIKEFTKNGRKQFSGFLPGFEFSESNEFDDINDCVDELQDMLDDFVEELVIFEKQLPDIAEDEVLLKQYPGHRIVYLDINVYALPDEDCKSDCTSCPSYNKKCNGKK